MLKIDAAPNTPDNKSSGDEDGAVDELSVKRAGRLIDEAMRDSDLAGRWGYDEFLVLCRDEDPKRILGFGDRLRAIIEEETASTSNPLTVSVGVSLFPLFEHFDETVERVTTALQEAHAAGKNCVKAEWRTGVAL
jgi:diguanylate cyclase (GGDEF)-like protein